MIYRILQTGCLATGILCFTYFIIVLLYAGIFTSALFLWPLGGCFLLVCAWTVRKAAEKQTFGWYAAMTCLLLMLLAVIAICVWWGSRIIPYTLHHQQERRNLAAGASDDVLVSEEELYVIILGAHVRKTVPSKALQRRLECALRYHEQEPAAVFVLSGGQGFGEEITEAQCMEEYLLKRGIAKEQLLQEDKSTSTLENLLFSDERYQLKSHRVGVISNDFHVYRALALAKAMGYQDVFGIPASSDLLMQPHNILREICCLIKERMLARM